MAQATDATVDHSREEGYCGPLAHLISLFPLGQQLLHSADGSVSVLVGPAEQCTLASFVAGLTVSTDYLATAGNTTSALLEV